MSQQMATMYVLGRIMQRLKGILKDEKTEQEIEKILKEELCEIFHCFVESCPIC